MLSPCFWLWFSELDPQAEAHSTAFLPRTSKRHEPAVVDSLNQPKQSRSKEAKPADFAEQSCTSLNSAFSSSRNTPMLVLHHLSPATQQHIL